jgi:hypothetical protein
MKKLQVLFVAVVLLVLATLSLQSLLPASVVWALLLGWVGFLGRVVPRLSPDSTTVIAAVIAVVLFTLGVHWLGRKSVGTTPAARWTLRRSVAVTMLLFILFAAGVAMVGLTHMTYWLATSPEPFRVESPWDQFDRTQRSSDNVRRLAYTFHNEANSRFSSRLAPAATFDENGRPLHGWETQLIPYLDHRMPGIDKKRAWDDPSNAPYFRTRIPEFLNPALVEAPEADGRGFFLDHYAANSHVIRANGSLRVSEITFPSTAILVGEINDRFQPWGQPLNVRDPALGINRSPRGFGGAPGARGAFMVMGDASVRFISDDVDPEVLRALSRPGDER